MIKILILALIPFYFFTSFCQSTQQVKKFDLKNIPSEWVQLTEKDGKLVIFNSCDGGNLLISIKNVNNKYQLLLHGQQEDVDYEVLDVFQVKDTIKIKAKFKDSEGKQIFNFIWIDKNKKLSKWVTAFYVSDDSILTLYTSDTCVALEKQHDFPVINQPCRECWGDDCDEIEGTFNKANSDTIIQTLSFSQTNPPIDVTPTLQKKIMQYVDKEALQLKRRLVKAKENQVHIEFAIDTFRVERFMAKWINLDNSDFGMRNAGYTTAKLYDSLLNKYYKKLLAVLKGEDKKTLVQSQRAWLTFRDRETKLINMISKDEYSGGGTMQQLIEASEYFNLIKNRTITLFEHYVRTTQSY